MRVVIDTNVFISGSFWKGNEEKVIDICISNEIWNFTSFQIINEIESVLMKERFHLEVDEIEDLMKILISFSKIVDPKTSVHIIEKDPSDNKFLECAIEANCDVLITGDAHLLEVKEFCGVKIMNAKEFLNLEKTY